jgi:hypothetical protein
MTYPTFDEVVTNIGAYDRLAATIILDEVNRQRSGIMRMRAEMAEVLEVLEDFALDDHEAVDRARPIARRSLGLDDG